MATADLTARMVFMVDSVMLRMICKSAIGWEERLEEILGLFFDILCGMDIKSSKEVVAEGQKILREKLIDSLWEDMSVRMPDPEMYVQFACEDLEQVWASGQKLFQLDELGNIASTEFATFCDEYDLSDFMKMGSSTEYLEIFDWDAEDISPEERLRRGFVMAAKDQPERLLREEFEKRFGVDPLNDGDFELGD